MRCGGRLDGLLVAMRVCGFGRAHTHSFRDLRTTNPLPSEYVFNFLYTFLKEVGSEFVENVGLLFCVCVCVVCVVGGSCFGIFRYFVIFS